MTNISVIGHFRVVFTLFFKASISVSYERSRTRPRFEKEAKGNSENGLVPACVRCQMICKSMSKMLTLILFDLQPPPGEEGLKATDSQQTTN